MNRHTMSRSRPFSVEILLVLWYREDYGKQWIGPWMLLLIIVVTFSSALELNNDAAAALHLITLVRVAFQNSRWFWIWNHESLSTACPSKISITERASETSSPPTHYAKWRWAQILLQTWSSLLTLLPWMLRESMAKIGSHCDSV